MRITENTNFNAVRQHIGRSKEKMDRLSNQAATLQRVLEPSDDPASAVKIMEIKTSLMNSTQHIYNAQLARSHLEVSENALSDLTDILLRAKELSINMSSDPSSSDVSRRSVSQEVQALFDGSIVIANRKLGERYLFGGYQIQQPPYLSNGNYQGDTGSIHLEIETNAFININIHGDEIFNTYFNQDEPNTDNRINHFQVLDSLRIALMTGDMENIRASIDHLDRLTEHIVELRAKIGARLSHLETNIRSLEKQQETSTALLSQVEDADLADVVIHLSKQEAIYKNALASSQRLIQPNLLDFLK